MSEPLRMIPVKLTPVGRPLLFEGQAGSVPPRVGEAIVVQTDGGPALGTVARSIPQVDARHPLGADSSHRVIRLATHEDILVRELAAQFQVGIDRRQVGVRCAAGRCAASGAAACRSHA